MVAAERSVNMSCSRSICRRISAMRRSLSSRWRSEHLRSSSLSCSRRTCSSAISFSRLSRSWIDDADHLREAGDLRQSSTRSCLTLGGCACGVSARFLHWFVYNSGSGCHTGCNWQVPLMVRLTNIPPLPPNVIERGRSGEEESWRRVGFPNGRYTYDNHAR